MSDDKTETGDPDRRRIAMKEDYEVRDWSAKFRVTPEKLKQAVDAVGNQAGDVEAWLKSS